MTAPCPWNRTDTGTSSCCASSWTRFKRSGCDKHIPNHFFTSTDMANKDTTQCLCPPLGTRPGCTQGPLIWTSGPRTCGGPSGPRTCGGPCWKAAKLIGCCPVGMEETNSWHCPCCFPVCGRAFCLWGALQRRASYSPVHSHAHAHHPTQPLSTLCADASSRPALDGPTQQLLLRVGQILYM